MKRTEIRKKGILRESVGILTGIHKGYLIELDGSYIGGDVADEAVRLGHEPGNELMLTIGVEPKSKSKD